MTQSQSNVRIRQTEYDLTGARIFDAPSREALFDASRLFVVVGVAEVEFRLAVYNPRRGREEGIRVTGNCIQGLVPADGSGNEWMGKVSFRPSTWVALPHYDPYDFFINTHTRKGKIIDARPANERSYIDPNGDVWLGTLRLGNIADLRPKPSSGGF